VPVGGSKPIGLAPRPGAAGRLAELTASLREFGRRRRTLITVVGSLATAAILLLLLAGRRHEFAAAISDVAVWVLGVSVLAQIVALVSRSEAWHLTIEAAGGTVDRRVLYRASSMQVLGSVINGHLGVAARIAALRRSSPTVSPQVPTLIAAEFPILAVEAVLAALASFTLIAPLGLPWWLPLIGVAVIATVSAGLRHLALRKGRELWSGLAVLRTLRGGSLVIAFVLVAVLAQIFRNWLLLHAVGVDASIFDAVAVLIALVTLGQLPVGPTVGAAATVLILGSDGVAAAAAAGVLMTVTGTIGGLCFAAWAGADRLWSRSWGRASPRRAIGSRDCDDPAMSRRDLAHVTTALWNLSGGEADVAVDVAEVEDAIGRGRGDMRTPLDLQSLGEQGVVVALADGSWALTPQGVARVAQDRELSDRCDQRD